MQHKEDNPNPQNKQVIFLRIDNENIMKRKKISEQQHSLWNTRDQ